MTMATQSTSFAKDIRPLFRAKDINAMKKAFDLSDYEDVRSHADAILGKVSAGSMRRPVATGPGGPLPSLGPGGTEAVGTEP